MTAEIGGLRECVSHIDSASQHDRDSVREHDRKTAWRASSLSNDERSPLEEFVGAVLIGKGIGSYDKGGMARPEGLLPMLIVIDMHR
jgi:hypothetical protein